MGSLVIVKHPNAVAGDGYPKKEYSVFYHANAEDIRDAQKWVEDAGGDEIIIKCLYLDSDDPLVAIFENALSVAGDLHSGHGQPQLEALLTYIFMLGRESMHSKKE